MPFYSWFYRQGRLILIKKLRTENPFDLTPHEIVDRIIKAGYTPAIERPHNLPFHGVGRVSEVELEGFSYLVSVSREAEEIRVQEWRDDPYYCDPFW